MNKLTTVETAEAENIELSFACLVQDSETLENIQEQYNLPDITAASFKTDTGDYDPLYIRYGYPSFRSGGQWYKVTR